MTTSSKGCRQCRGKNGHHKMDCSEPRIGNRQEPVEGILPNVTSSAIAASKRQIVESLNRLEANGVYPGADSIGLTDGSEINRYGDADWRLEE